MRRETQHLILLLLGGAVLKISLNGNYARYVKPALGPWLTVTGAAAMLLAVALIAASLRNKPAEHEHGHHHPSRMAWLLMVPALALLFAPPPVLTVDQPAAQAQAAPADPAPYPPLPPGRPPLKLIDFVGRALGAPATLDGREVSLVGFVRKLPDGLYLARVFIWCCAADARSVVLKLDMDPARFPARDFADKQWVQLIGTYVPGSIDNDPEDIPTVRVIDVTPIPQPENPYET